MPEDRMPDEWFERTTALTLQKVVPIVQRRRVAGIMVALSYLEVHEAGYGVLRTLISRESRWPSPWERRGLPEPEVHARHGVGLSCEARLLEASGVLRDADGATILSGLPNSGELEIEVARVLIRNYSGEGVAKSWTGPWIFRFSI